MALKARVTCVLLGGLLCNEKIFSHQAESLSSTAQVEIHQINATSVAAAVDDVLAKRMGSFALVGYSLGAAVAMACAIRAPERVSHLGLIAANPYEPRSDQLKVWRHWHYLATHGRFEQAIDEVGRGMLRSGTDDPHAQRVRAMAEAVGPTSFVRQLRLQASRTEMIGELSNITAPTLVMGGARDPLVPVEYQEVIATAITGAELCIDSDAGHLLPWERALKVSGGITELLSRPVG